MAQVLLFVPSVAAPTTDRQQRQSVAVKILIASGLEAVAINSDTLVRNHDGPIVCFGWLPMRDKAVALSEVRDNRWVYVVTGHDPGDIQLSERCLAWVVPDDPAAHGRLQTRLQQLAAHITDHHPS